MVDTPAVEEPFSPDISHANPADKGTWFGHPRQLARLFTTEMWERFGYYGMRALLTLYLTKHFLFSRPARRPASTAAITALVYLTPLIGGFLADQYLGSKRSVKFGAILMALGYFTLCFGGETGQAVRDRSTASATKCRSTIPSTARPATGDEARYVVDQRRAAARSRATRTAAISLLDADGQVARNARQGRDSRPAASATRSDRHAHADRRCRWSRSATASSSPTSRPSSARSTRRATAAATPASPSSTWASTSARSSSSSSARSSPTGRLVGGLRPRRRRHADQLVA